MKIFAAALLILTLSSCASKTLIRHEAGDIIASGQQKQQAPLPPKVAISIEPIIKHKSKHLKIRISEISRTNITWVDVYSGVDVYSQPCKSLISKIFSAYFAQSKDNSSMCESKVPSKETVSKDASKIDSQEVSLEGLSTILGIGDTSVSAIIKDGAIEIPYQKINFGQTKLPSGLRGTLDIGSIHLNITEDLNKFVEAQNAQIDREELAKSIAAENAKLGDDPPSPMSLEYYGIIKPGECIDSIHFPFTIVKKLNEFTYEMVAETGDIGAIHILLRTKKASFGNAGHPVGIGVRHTGTRTVALQNGFDSNYPVFSECTPYRAPSSRDR